MLSITTNTSSLIAQNSLKTSTNKLNQAIERMSTGSKINRAKDNAANYSISENLTRKINSLLQISNNSESGISMLTMAQGALEEMSNKLLQMRRLSVQALNNAYDETSLSAMQAEADSIVEEIDYIRENTVYEGRNLFYTPNNTGTSTTKTQTTSAQNESIMLAEASDDTITGSIDIAANDTQSIIIDGMTYTVTNKLSNYNSLSYSKNKTTGEITFLGSCFTVRGQTDVAHNLIIEGDRNTIVTGKLDDTIIINSSSVATVVYAGEGDDVITTYAGSCTLHAEDGNDTINAFGNRTTAYGGDGNDIFNIKDTYEANFYGQNGDDTFTISSYTANSVFVDGGEGTNTANNNSGNALKINVEGSTAQFIKFNANETKDVTINGIQYKITNTENKEANVIYSVESDGQIIFETKKLLIYGEKNKAHNVMLRGTNIEFHGGDLADRIISAASVHKLYGEGGDDYILAFGYTELYGGDGNDTLELRNYYNNAFGNDGDDIVILNKGGTNNIDLGNGDDILRTNYNIINSVVIGGNGNNTIEGSNTINNSLLHGFGTKDTTEARIDFAANEIKNIVINGITYQVKNRQSAENSMIYYYNPVTGKVSLGGFNYYIKCQNDVSHDISLYGRKNELQGGNCDDTIDSYSYLGTILGGAGNDTITLYTGDSTMYGEDGDDHLIVKASTHAYGGNGNDTIEIFTGLYPSYVVNGESGDDTYIINNKCTVSDKKGNNIFTINADGAAVSGGIGNDTFYIKGSNNTTLGAGGDDYFIIDGANNLIDGGTGNNYYVDNGSGNSVQNVATISDSGILTFTSKNEVKSFTLAGKTYTVKNNLSGANTLSYYLNKNTGLITLAGSSLQIDANSNEAARLEVRGDNNIINGSNLADNITIADGVNNIVNGLAGNDTLIMNSKNNSLNGGDGNDTLNVNETTTLEINGGTGDDVFNVESSNNTNIVTNVGNNTVIVNGTSNSIKATNGDNNIILNNSKNTVNAGDGNNNFTINGSDNTVTAGNGKNTLGINGNNNNVNMKNANGSMNIIGNNNTVSNTRGENSITIKGNDNEYTSMSGNKDILLEGTNNEVLTGTSNDNITVKGDSNIIESTGGTNTITIKGDTNQIQGGIGVDTIKINGNDNIANGGDGNDKFTISAGNNNSVDGEAGSNNTIINKGENTQFINAIDITPKNEPIVLKVDLGTDDSSFVSIEISFDIEGFSIDFKDSNSLSDSIAKIDELQTQINEQLINIGTIISRLESILEHHALKLNNMISSRSTIRDADIAKESSNYIKMQILQQASAALLATANQTPAIALQLL